MSKFDSDGAPIWVAKIGTDKIDYAYGVAVDAHGDAFITGYTSGVLFGDTSAGYQDVFVAKFSSDGDLL